MNKLDTKILILETILELLGKIEPVSVDDEGWDEPAHQLRFALESHAHYEIETIRRQKSLEEKQHLGREKEEAS